MKEYKMIMRSYSLNELSNEAKEKAYKDFASEFDVWLNGYGYDYEEVIKAFSEIFDVEVSWSFDGYRFGYDFEISNGTLSDDDSNMQGIRLAKYIWNNYSKYICEGKYYSTGEISKPTRRSKLVKLAVDDCPMTGICYDVSILEPIKKCLCYEKMYDSYADLIDECLSSFFKEAEEEVEYCQSMEYFEQESDANEWEYEEDGSPFFAPSKAERIL